MFSLRNISFLLSTSVSGAIICAAPVLAEQCNTQLEPGAGLSDLNPVLECLQNRINELEARIGQISGGAVTQTVAGGTRTLQPSAIVEVREDDTLNLLNENNFVGIPQISGPGYSGAGSLRFSYTFGKESTQLTNWIYPGQSFSFDLDQKSCFLDNEGFVDPSADEAVVTIRFRCLE